MGHVHLVFSTPLVPTILLSSLLWFPKVLVMFGYVTLSHQLLEEVSLLTTGLSNVTMSIVEYLQESFYYFFVSHVLFCLWSQSHSAYRFWSSRQCWHELPLVVWVSG